MFPRARIISGNATTITAKSAGDTKGVLITITLPANFAYSFQGGFAFLTSATAADVDNYQAINRISIQDRQTGVSFDWADMDFTSPGAFVFASSDPTTAGKIYNVPERSMNRDVFYNLLGEGPRVFVTLNDTDGTNATAQSVVTYRFTFLQYDIEQVLNVAVNAPQPVSVR